MTTTFQDLNLPALVEARKDSPDWQAAQNVAIALQMGQVALDVEKAPARFAQMHPANRERVVDLVRRYRDLTVDATALVEEIDRDLQKSI